MITPINQLNLLNQQDLEQRLGKIKQQKRELEEIKSQLNQHLSSIDKLIPEQDLIWAKHHQKHVGQLVKELQELHGISLTTEEQTSLNNLNYNSINKKLANLKNLKLNIDKQTSVFSIIAYDAVIKALSRSLQKLDIAPKVIKKLPVIDQEEKAGNQIKSQFNNQYQTITTAGLKLKAMPFKPDAARAPISEERPYVEAEKLAQ